MGNLNPALVKISLNWKTLVKLFLWKKEISKTPI